MDELEKSIAASAKKNDRWARVAVVTQQSEAADVPAVSTAKWSSIYRLFDASGETEQDEVFAAVNLYFLKNGCSPDGKYSKPVKTAGGKSALSGEVVKITGKLEGEIRQFLRGRLADSVAFLRNNPGVKQDDEIVAAAQAVGLPREYCWLVADWLGKTCSYLVGEELTLYNNLRTQKIVAARAKDSTTGESKNLVSGMTPELQPTPKREYNHDLF